LLLHLDPHAPLALAERILELLDQGRFTATYKYAVLLDLCLENAARDGAAPDLLTTLGTGACSTSSSGSSRLWLRGDEFVTANRPALEAALDATAA